MTIDVVTRAPHAVATSTATALDQHGDRSDAVRQLLDAIFDTSRDATVIVDDGGQLVYITQATADLLGYDRHAAIGRSVFEFLHPDDVAGAVDLFDRRLRFAGGDLGTELRIHHASGTTITTLATASVLPAGAAELGVGACAIHLRVVGDADVERELALQRRIVVGEYTNTLGTDLMAAAEPGDVLARVEVALGEIALLTGADIVLVCLERPNGSGVEVLAVNRHDDGTGNHVGAGHDGPIALLDDHLAIDDLTARHQHLTGVFGFDSRALVSTPFTAGSRRGALVLLRTRPAIWLDSDSDLARGAAVVISRALHAAWSDQLLSLMYHSGPVAFSIHRWDGELVDCNEPYLELFAVDRRHADDHATMQSVSEPGRTELTAQIDRLRSGEITRVDLELEISRYDGEPIWVRETCVRLGVPGSIDDVILSSYADITNRQRQRMELEHAANHDPLTGVANRTSLWSTIGRMTDEHGRLPALLIVDLDRFKHVNDTHGHRTGDLVLQSVVRRLRAHVRTDDVIARLGGDEFAVALPGVTVAEAEATARRLRAAFEDPIEIDGRFVTQTLSVGVAAGPDCTELADLMVRADRALYAAKHRGRNCHVVFHTDMDDVALADVQLERELRVAIENEELEVYFQPEFAIDDLAIVGAEALVRWQHPERGLVAAGMFISIAERTGLIDEIGRFALRRATRDFARACDGSGRDDLTLRVNISAREFARPELADIVRSAVERSGLDPARLCLEMTETTLMDAPEIALATFATLHDIGVQFAIDDFGTGYSSLAYLKRFPVDVLKIDQAFVHDIDHDSESRAIVSSILGLADSLSLDVVAEGVEHEGQLTTLAELGCNRAQGYYVAPAVPLPNFVALLERRTQRRPALI